LAGVAGLVAGAFSMAAGEFVSMRAQSELMLRELDVERLALRRWPKDERDELHRHLRTARGIDRDVAEQLVDEVMSDPELALADPRARGARLRPARDRVADPGVGLLVLRLRPRRGASPDP
jgi:VIT1/CCC1 family predicted Fe2+/Mn2+ transporter